MYEPDNILGLWRPEVSHCSRTTASTPTVAPTAYTSTRSYTTRTCVKAAETRKHSCWGRPYSLFGPTQARLRFTDSSIRVHILPVVIPSGADRQHETVKALTPNESWYIFLTKPTAQKGEHAAPREAWIRP